MLNTRQTLFGDVFWSSEWASSQEGHRKNIRLEIFNQTLESNVLDLEKVPILKQGSVSISHNPLAGGYAYSGLYSIGFDIEVKKRITEKLIKRVSLLKEVDVAGRLSPFLWTIKESCFKLMGCSEKVMGDFIVTSFDSEISIAPGSFQEGFLFKVFCGKREFKSFCFEIDGLLFSISKEI